MGCSVLHPHLLPLCGALQVLKLEMVRKAYAHRRRFVTLVFGARVLLYSLGAAPRHTCGHEIHRCEPRRARGVNPCSKAGSALGARQVPVYQRAKYMSKARARLHMYRNMPAVSKGHSLKQASCVMLGVLDIPTLEVRTAQCIPLVCSSSFFPFHCMHNALKGMSRLI